MQITELWRFLLLLPLVAILGACQAGPKELVVYVAGGGIHTYRMDLATGAMRHVATSDEVKPNFLALHPGGSLLYAVDDDVNAFSIDHANGQVTLLNNKPPGGQSPCHIVVDSKGKNVLVANYSDGSLAALPIADDGRLKDPSSVKKHEGSSLNKSRQESPHAHSINLSPDDRFAFCADLGIDQVVVYSFDSSTGQLKDNGFAPVAPGAGPRHFTFHPSGDYAYVINELGNTVVAFSYDKEKGVLKEIQTIKTLPEDFTEPSYTAEVLIDPSGRFLYGSNRGHESIVVFAIDSGKLTLVEHEPTQGKHPRNFRIDPTGQYLLVANAQSNNIVIFRIHPVTGELDPTGDVLEVESPMCIKFWIPTS